MGHIQTLEKPKKPARVGTTTMFKNPILERLSRTHIAIPLTIFFSISAGLMYYGLTTVGISSGKALLLFIAGMLTFSLIEYVMHRYLFHLTPTTPQREKIAYTVHGIHHDYPKDKDRLAMPPVLSLTLAFVFFMIYKFIMGSFVFAFLPGFLIGYALYLFVHYSVHAFQPPKNFLKILWIHHGIHHYKDHDRAFGVSSPLWDYIFGTMPKK